jgi:ribosomal protein S18 acetylase RimI-like enzyme
MREDEFLAWSDDARAWRVQGLVEIGGVRAQGLDRIMLNVFGGNEQARRLYRNLGYDVAAAHMSKVLA